VRKKLFVLSYEVPYRNRWVTVERYSDNRECLERRLEEINRREDRVATGWREYDLVSEGHKDIPEPT
jgi:hypothetical protein